MKVFERATVYNDPLKVYTSMVDIHERAGDSKMVETLYTTMARKFKQTQEVRIGPQPRVNSLGCSPHALAASCPR